MKQFKINFLPSALIVIGFFTSTQAGILSTLGLDVLSVGKPTMQVQKENSVVKVVNDPSPPVTTVNETVKDTAGTVSETANAAIPDVVDVPASDVNIAPVSGDNGPVKTDDSSVTHTTDDTAADTIKSVDPVVETSVAEPTGDIETSVVSVENGDPFSDGPTGSDGEDDPNAK